MTARGKDGAISSRHPGEPPSGGRTSTFRLDRHGSLQTGRFFRYESWLPENANVSTTSPSIKAIGTTSGIGVYKDLGKFKFYDGIITASTSAIPRDNITTDVEHLYEPTFHTDAYGNDVCILTWMRDLPSQPGN